MANPQVEEGHIRIANEIWDQLMMRDFTKRQRAILDLILRLSYGCGKKQAVIPTLNSFSLAGVRPNHIREELERLEQAGVIVWDRVSMQFSFNKDYDQWQIERVSDYDEERLADLVFLNLTGKSRQREVPKTGSQRSPNLGSHFPKQEVDVPETGSRTSRFGKSEVPKTGSATSQNRNIEGTETPITTSSAGHLKPMITSLKTEKDIQSFVAWCRDGNKDPLFEAWRQLVGLVGPSVGQKLDPFVKEYGMNVEVVILAIMRGVERLESDRRKPTPGYVEGILRNWYNDGIRTLADLKSREPPKTEEDFVAAILAKAAQAEEVFK